MTDTWQLLLETPLVNLMALLSTLAFGSYGAAILLFTLLTRAITFPLTMRTLRATRGLQELQPDMAAIQKKYSDPKRRSEEQMKLYRRKTLACERAGLAAALLGAPAPCDWTSHGTDRDALFREYETHLERTHQVRAADASSRQLRKARGAIGGGINPIGCLGPQLVQFPIFFALYSVIRLTLSQAPEDILELSDRLYNVGVLQNSIPLGTSFLGMNLGDNGNIVLVAVIFCSMWLTQRISSSRAMAQPGSQQAQMQQMMQWMLPLMFGWFALFVPAGLGPLLGGEHAGRAGAAVGLRGAGRLHLGFARPGPGCAPAWGCPRSWRRARNASAGASGSERTRAPASRTGARARRTRKRPARKTQEGQMSVEEVSGKTAEDAVERALAKLGVARDRVDVEVIREGRKGLLGFGGEDAIVRVTHEGRPAPPGAARRPRPARRREDGGGRPRGDGGPQAGGGPQAAADSAAAAAAAGGAAARAAARTPASASRSAASCRRCRARPRSPRRPPRTTPRTRPTSRGGPCATS